MAENAYYRTVLTIELLGNEPYVDGIENLDYAANNDYSGTVLSSDVTVLNAEQMAELLISQGSDPEFLLGDNYLGEEE